MHLDYRRLLDLLFPPSDDERLIRDIDAQAILSKYAPTTSNGITTLTSFHDEVVRAAIHLTKFHHHPQAINLLATLLSHHFTTIETGTITIIPTPLSAARERSRGYNQVAEVARAAALQLPTLSVRTDILYRTQDTVPQTSLNREKRLRNMQDAFAIRPNFFLNTEHILLLDDVTTTGATLQAAKAALLPLSPASLTCVALAH